HRAPPCRQGVGSVASVAVRDGRKEPSVETQTEEPGVLGGGTVAILIGGVVEVRVPHQRRIDNGIRAVRDRWDGVTCPTTEPDVLPGVHAPNTQGAETS